MDTEQNQNTDTEVEEVSEEEKKSETEALAEVKEEELKSKIAEDLGISPEDESELVDNIFKRELAQRERLSGAIKQKISWRDKATKKTTNKPTDTPEEGKPQTEEGKKPLTAEEFEKRLDEREAKRDLEGLGLSDEIQAEVKDLAKVKGISVRDAAKLPYIVSIIEEAKKAKRIESATPKRKGRGGYASVDIDPTKPLDYQEFDHSTKEGRKAWKEAKEARQAHRAQK